MSADPIVRELVAANRILAANNVIDAFGHVSVRDPHDAGRFYIATSKSPALVTEDDIVTVGVDGEPTDPKRSTYIERYIHAAIYEARPEILSVVHSHADDVVPYSVSIEPLRPVLHTAAAMGSHIAVWDIRTEFGDHTDLLVRNLAQGRDLAKKLGPDRVVLMRGHGFAAAGRSLFEAVKISVYLPRNARILSAALAFGHGAVTLSDGEVESLSKFGTDDPSSQRAWSYWCSLAGLAADGSVQP